MIFYSIWQNIYEKYEALNLAEFLDYKLLPRGDILCGQAILAIILLNIDYGV